MNIAVITNDYAPPWDEGTKKIIRTLVQHLESQGDKITIISDDLIRKSRILPDSTRRIGMLRQIETIYLYKKILKDKQIDVMFKVTQSASFFAVKSYLYEKILGKPYYLYVSSISHEQKFYKVLLNQKRVIVGGNYLKRYFPYAHLIFPVIDMNKTGEALGYKRSEISNPKVILFLGAFQKERGVENLIRAVSRLKIKNEIRLILAWNGRGNLLNDIKNLIKEKELENVVSLIGSTDIGELYKKAHIVVIPRIVGDDLDRKMFFPLRIIESMSFGKPLVVSDVYDLGIAIKGCGIAVKPGSIDELEKAIEKLCTDQEFYESCSQECERQFKEKYHPLLNLKKIYEILHADT